ncbi:MAG: 30S ribosome-binding factor RbfA [Buchnera aphidicola (Nurudea shiraii)]
MLQSNRSLRVSKELKKEISWVIKHFLGNFFLKFLITVSEVQVSRDLNYSKVYISVFNTDTMFSSSEVISKLQKSASYIRYILAKRIFLRVVPVLSFFYDDSLIKGIRMNNLINKSLLHEAKKKL